jgi:hypothetical protein
MKTTVEIDTALLVRAKKRAAEEHRPLRSLIEAGLRDLLGRRYADRRASSPSPSTIRWVVHDGGLPEGLDVADRSAMAEWLDRTP